MQLPADHEASDCSSHESKQVESSASKYSMNSAVAGLKHTREGRGEVPRGVVRLEESVDDDASDRAGEKQHMLPAVLSATAGALPNGASATAISSELTVEAGLSGLRSIRRIDRRSSTAYISRLPFGRQCVLRNQIG